MKESDWIDLGKDSLSSLNTPRFDRMQAFVERRRNFKLVYEDNQVDDLTTGREAGIGLTAVEDRNTHFFCFSLPEDCRRELPVLRTLLSSDAAEPGPIDWRKPEHREQTIEQDISGTPEERKVTRVRRANEEARMRDDRIHQVRVVYSEKRRDIVVIDREGWIRTEPQRYTNFYVTAIAQSNGRRERGYGRLAGYCGEELFDERSPEELAREAAEQALTALEAEPVAAGPTTVVVGPGFGGTIFHEACGHGFEADHIYEGVSRYTGQRGERVASEGVTFVDDATLPKRYGSFCFDDEGTPASRTVLIREGVMESMMSDRKYARLLGVDPSGNGRRESYQYPALPRMTNTFIESGDTDPDDIIEDTEDGVYAAHIGGGQVDTASGDFIFSVTEGYRIENGALTHPIRDAALVGNGPAVLKRIDAVGNDLELTPGVCGKGQWVPVSVGQPTLRVQELTIGGEDA